MKIKEPQKPKVPAQPQKTEPEKPKEPEINTKMIDEEWESLYKIIINEDEVVADKVFYLKNFIKKFRGKSQHVIDAQNVLLYFTNPKQLEVKNPGRDKYWQRCPLGQAYFENGCEGETQKMSWNEAIKACPDGYRLPDLGELVILLQGCDFSAGPNQPFACKGCPDSLACSQVFGTDRNLYWTSDETESGNNAWFVNFNNGVVRFGGKHFEASVRCLRGE